MRFWGAQGLCGTGTDKLDQRLQELCSWREPPMLSTRLAGTPQILLAWESHPKFSREGPANASPKAATCFITPDVGLAGAGGGFLTPRAAGTGPTCATAYPPQGALRKAAGIAKSRDPVPMLRRHLCQQGLCPFPAFAWDAGPLPPSGRMCSLVKIWGIPPGQASAKSTHVGGRQGHPSAVCTWMGTSPKALQASSPSCQLLQGQGYLCSAIKEPRDLRELGMREEKILTRGWTTSK